MEVAASCRRQIPLEGLGRDADNSAELDDPDVAFLNPAVDGSATDLKQIGNLVHGVEQLGSGTDGFHVAALRTGVGGHGRRIAM